VTDRLITSRPAPRSAPEDVGTSGPDGGLPDIGRSAGGGGSSGEAPPSRRAKAAHRVGGALRTHWFFALMFTVGAAGRVLTMVAYRPALLYIDSFGYLANSKSLNPTGNEPIGYPLVLRVLLHLGDFETVVALQHLLGLAMGLCVYVLLLRYRMPKTLAVLASAPVLLDAYEWQIEQNILTDSLFLALITAALVLLTWRRRPGPWLAAGAGLLLGAAVTVRLVGEAALVPAVLFVVLAAGPDWRRRIKAVAAFGIACAVPLGSYAVYMHGFTGTYGLPTNNSIMLYGRTAEIADCASLSVGVGERPEVSGPGLLLLQLHDVAVLHGPGRAAAGQGVLRLRDRASAAPVRRDGRAGLPGTVHRTARHRDRGDRGQPLAIPDAIS